jgi:hypothetical protein
MPVRCRCGVASVIGVRIRPNAVYFDAVKFGGLLANRLKQAPGAAPSSINHLAWEVVAVIGPRTGSSCVRGPFESSSGSEPSPYTEDPLAPTLPSVWAMVHAARCTNSFARSLASAGTGREPSNSNTITPQSRSSTVSGQDTT